MFPNFPPSRILETVFFFFLPRAKWLSRWMRNTYFVGVNVDCVDWGRNLVTSNSWLYRNYDYYSASPKNFPLFWTHEQLSSCLGEEKEGSQDGKSFTIETTNHGMAEKGYKQTNKRRMWMWRPKERTILRVGYRCYGGISNKMERTNEILCKVCKMKYNVNFVNLG